MAVAWKKVYTTGDQILVTDGGTGVDTIPSGALVGNAAGDAITAQPLTADQFLMGVGATDGDEKATTITDPTSFSTVTADVGITGSANGIRKFTLGDGVVTGGAGGKMAIGTTNWEINEATITGNAGGVVAFGSAQDVTDGNIPIIPGSTTYVTAAGQPYVLTPPSSGPKVLQFTGGQLSWEDVGTGSATDVYTNEDCDTSSALPVAFTDGGATSALNTCVASLGFTPDVAKLTVGGITLTGTTNINTVTAPGDSTDSDIGFIGTATNATKVTVNNLDGVTGSNLEVLIGGGVGAGKQVWSDRALFYNTTGGTDNAGLLTVPNLTVTGTTTTVNSTTVTISDKLITLAYDADQDANVDDSSLVNAGIALGLSGTDTGTLVADDLQLPRIVYRGADDTISPSKWAITRSQPNGTGAFNANTLHGIAVMSNESTIVGSTAMTGAVYGTDVGVGAPKIDQDGSLWIQTAVA